jgi:ATP-binding cassette subfamily B protein
MPKTQDQTKNPADNAYQRVSFNDLVKVSKWVVGFVYSLSPSSSTVYIVFSILTDLKNILYSYIFARTIDAAIKVAASHGNISQMIPYLVAILIYNTVSMSMSYGFSIIRRTLNAVADLEVQRKIYYKIKDLGVQTLEQPETNNKIYRANDSMNSTIDYFTELVNILSSAVTFVVAGILLFKALPIILPLVVITSLPRYLTDKRFRVLIYKLQYENTEDLRKANLSSNDLTTPNKLPEIFLNGAFSFLDKKYTGFMGWYTKTRLNYMRQNTIINFFLEVLGSLSYFAGYFVLLVQFIQNKVTVGTVYFNLGLIQRFQDEVANVISLSNDITEYVMKIKDTYELFQMQPAFDDGTVAMEPLKSGPDIKFNNVCFQYPNSERFVLKDVNLHIKPGEKVAIIGHNGAGKTTLVRLICRLYKVTEGAILVNDQNIKELTIGSLHKNIGVLFQDFNLHPQLTVKENIVIGNTDKEVTEEEIYNALGSADAVKFVQEYPKVLDQTLSERYKGGIRPSTGQWQKIAIARFFYRNAPLVIFDEPTASIDPVSEYNIFNKIYDFFAKKTVIIISHRFSTVRNADRIIVLDEGKIVEEGTHAELMKNNGPYAKAFLLQAEGYKD